MADRKKRILVVDGDSFLSYILAIRFREAGFNSLAADSLDEAWGQVADFRPDVVVAAVDLGKNSGYDLLDRIRRWEAKSGRQTRIVLLDRMDNINEFNRSRAKKADGYIAKTTASFSDMLAIVNRVLTGKKTN